MGRVRDGLGHHSIRAIGELVDPPQLLWAARERRKHYDVTTFFRRERAIGPGDGDLEVWRSGIAAGVGDGGDRPLLLGLRHVGRHAYIEGNGRPVPGDLRRVLVGYGFSADAIATSVAPPTT